MVLCGRVGDYSILLLPLTLTLLYFGGLIVSVVNTINFRRRRSLYPGALINAHLSFCIIGSIAFFCVSAVMWLWSSKYASTHAEHIWRLCVGLWFMFLCRDMPLLIIETQAFLRVGWRQGSFMDASFILQIIFFVSSALASWTTISWYIAGFLERQFGSAMPVDQEGKPSKVPMAPHLRMQLAAAPEHPPALRIQDMRYIIAHPPRHGSSAPNPSWSDSPTRFDAANFSAQPSHVAAVHQGRAFIRGVEDEKQGIAMNNLRALPSEDDAGPHPAVI
ncbi:hypothetical protein GH5_00699 [Leishmania sp. Ghana 2012 LV757]|uniref:hypothetical protein n=1 Tax=Leishmania sp. Ghana 2012 LV757 TaxID=2803181 RepID=UPI001B52A922|nr:hypothetical protein GH5_00699 [Leishmania sp. Ghana 2012 LV757]